MTLGRGVQWIAASGDGCYMPYFGHAARRNKLLILLFSKHYG